MGCEVFQKVKVTVTANATNNTVGSATFPFRGVIRKIAVVAPAALDTSATFTISLLDELGATLYSKASLAANSTTSIPTASNTAAENTYFMNAVVWSDTPAEGTAKPSLAVLISGNQAATKDFTCYVYGEQWA
mgnify:CR=1